MKIAKFRIKGTRKTSYGIIDDGFVRPVKPDIYKDIKPLREEAVPLSKIELLCPASPTKIVLAGLNYRNHARELGMKIPSVPTIFLKPTSSLIGPGEGIVYPSGVRRLDYEAELALIIKREARSISEDKAYNYVFGYTCLNDVTARDLQKKDVQWTRAKSYDTFCPVGPIIETALDPSDLDIRLYLNNRLKQSSNTRNLIFPHEKLISFISRIMTLLPGDIIATGTPPGVGPMKAGDTVSVEIERIGTLTNKIIK